MKKNTKFIWICLLIIALQVGSISAVLVTYAADPGNDVTSTVASDFIQGVDLTEKNGSIPGNSLFGQKDVAKDIQFFLQYNFEVPNVHSIVEGDYLLFDVPAEIVFPTGEITDPIDLPPLLADVDGVTIAIAAASLERGNKIKIVFTDEVEKLSDVGGSFYLAGSFDQSKIKTNGESTDIQFGIPNRIFKIQVKADPIPEPKPVSVQKNGEIKSGTDIEWTITVNEENVKVNNAVLTDVIPSSQKLKESSITINSAAPTTEMTIDGNTLTVDLGSIDKKYEIKFVTSLKEEALMDALEEGETSIDVINTASLAHDDKKTTLVNNPPKVNIPLNILSKSGVYDNTTNVNNTKNITWTVVVNSDKLSFNNAVITDMLPAGLTYISGSESITGASGVTPIVIGSKLTFNLGNITDEVIITYRTEIDPAKFQANTSTNFINSATLTWEGLTGDGVTKNATVGVGSNLFTKSGAGYNRANGVISWSMSINNENIRLDAPTITDKIPADQQYIVGSAKIVDSQGNIYSGGIFNYVSSNSTLSYIFGGAINSKYTITFATKPVSTELITANASGEFMNTAKFTSGSISFDSTGTQAYNSNVFQKHQAGYDLATRTITWKFIVNENGKTTPSSNPAGTDPSLYEAISLANVSIKDAIPEGLKFLPDSVKVYGVNNNPVSNLVTTSGTDDVIFSFTNNITSQYTITFDTKITNLSKFVSQDNVLNNGNFSIKNEATLTHDETSKENTSNATQEVQNHIVSKHAIEAAGKKYVDWVVYLNSNAVNLNNLLKVDKFWLIDNLQEGLELDTTGVTLIEYDNPIVVPNPFPANGNDGLGVGKDITLTGDHIKYDATTRKFELNFPDGAIDKAYKLTYRTYVAENVSSKTTFSNSINLYGSTAAGTPVSIENAYQSGDSYEVSFLESGSQGYGNLGKFIVKKVDLEVPSKGLSGATFALYDRFGNKVQEKTTVDGELEFNRIKYDLPYYIKEVNAPEGYLLGGNAKIGTTATTFSSKTALVANAIEVTLKSGSNTSTIDLTFSNQQIKANIEFVKVSEKGVPLAGAVFDLLNKDKVVVDTATSDTNGKVTFTKVREGEYIIREKKPPTGYKPLPIDVATVVINAQNHDITVELPEPVTNHIIKGNIEFKKVDKSTAKGIKNARFVLYAADDTKFDHEIASAISDLNGLVRFEDVEYGDYTIVEVASPVGYYLSKEKLSASIKVEDKTPELETFENVKMPVEIIEGTIEINKVNTVGDSLSGAKFGLYNVMGRLVAEAVTNSSGIARFTTVPEGVYTVEELEAPKNYMKSDEVQNATISSEINDVKLKFVNERSSDAPWPGVSVQKVDDQGSPLAGVMFTLYKATDVSFTTPVASSTTNASGVATFAFVVPGKYVVKETQALEGYILSDITLSVTVVDDGKTYNAGTIENRVIRNDVVVNKVNEVDEPLQGAEFALYDKNGELFKTVVSNKNGVAEFKDTPYGSYTLKEKTAPKSYEKSDEVVAILITEDGKVQTVTFVNKKVTLAGVDSNNSNDESTNSNGSGSGSGSGTIDSGIESNNSNDGGTAGGSGNAVSGGNQLPKTGDSITTMLWLFGGSGLLIAALMLVSRRRAQKR